MSPRHLVFLLPVVLLLAACGAPPDVATPTPKASTSAGRIVVSPEPTAAPTTGLVFDLAAGVEQPAAAEAVPVAPAQPLDSAETQAILNRLPTLEPLPGDTQAFAFPPQSLPAPRPGVTVQEPFPPPPPVPTAAPDTAAGPLEVLRYAPEGAISSAANLNLTFNQPMVALTGLADLPAEGDSVPVKLAPQPAGQWRWVGTKTLVFEPAAVTGYAAGRFPMATPYTVTVPAGTTSAVGGKLAAAISFSFITPPPQVATTYPTGGPTALDPLLFVAFDQRIDPAAVLETIKLTAGAQADTSAVAPARAVAVEGSVSPVITAAMATPITEGPAIPVRLATAEEVGANKTVKQMADQAQPGYWLAFRAVEPLSAGRWFHVSIGPGTPSAEGPLTTSQAQMFSFRTYGPLKILESRCGWDNNCAPFMPWLVRFSNPLDQASITEETVRITPELPAAVINVYGDTLVIQGRGAGRTTYAVRLGADIRDIFGQTLGSDETVNFAVGSAEPVLYANGENFIVLDPSARPAYSVFTINYEKLAVRAYAVTPDDWTAFKQFQVDFYRNEKLPTPPGKQVLATTMATHARADELTETVIDLSELLPDGLGHLVILVEGETGALATPVPGRQSRPVAVYAWIQATKIGLDAFVDADLMTAWANALTDGAPLAGVELQLWPGDRRSETAADGTATLSLPAGRDATLLVARRGQDVAILPANTYFWGEGGWGQRSRLDSLAWYVFDDRGLYRPGEEVHVKGWVRRLGAGPRGDIGPLTGAAERVVYRLQDSRGNQVLDGAADLNALGGFDFKFTLAETMNLGDAYLQLQASGGSIALENTGFGHTIAVQEFRRPEFEVTATASEGPHFVGAGADLEVSAAYYAGGGLPNADVTWSITSRPGTYSPPGWDDFTFGRWVPWWRYWGWDKTPSVTTAQTFTGATDAAGIHRLRIDFRGVTPPEPSAVTAEATVMDVNRQAWTGAVNLLVHPASLYVGLRTERLFVAREEPLPVDIIVTDLDGGAVSGVTVTMKAARLAWQQRGGEWAEEEVASQPCTAVSAKEPVRCTFETPEGGTYRITATVTDPQGRLNRTEITRWVSGGERPPAREVEQEEATLIPDKKEYQPGDVAEILVQSPFYPAEGILTLRRSGLLRSERFTLEGPSTTLRIPIEEGFIPNVHVQVDLVGAAERTGDSAVAGSAGVPGPVATALPKRPAYAVGELNLTVPPLTRTLKVDAAPEVEKLEPGGSTQIDVTVRDAAGNPVAGAELAVVVVDEAILALTGYDITDPVAVFYAERGADVADHHSRADIVLANPEQLQTDQLANGMGGGRAAAMATAVPAAAPAPGMIKAEAASDAAGQAETAAIAVRTDFNPLAHWSPAVATDAQGRATVEVKLPDNLTRYRVTVVAVAGGKQFGKAASAITARLPLMARPSPPRFLNFGDKFELPVVVQNQTDEPMTVDVAVAAANAVLTDGSGRRVTVPANDRVEVRFPATTASAGTARFQVAAVQVLGGSTRPLASDAASFSLPVYTPATTEAFAVYGVLDAPAGSIAQPVIAPTGVFTQFGGLEITTSSTALQALTDAVLYLTQYPFECSEQLASRVLAIVALRDVLTAFQAEGLPPASELEATVKRDIERLQSLQNSDGGFAIWRQGAESWPYHTVHVANALQRAKLKGYTVPPEMLEQAKGYLRDIENRFPSWYGEDAKRAITAYALNVRRLMGDADPARARRMIDEVGLEKLSPEAIGWLLPVLSDDPASGTQVVAIRRHLLNRVTETAGSAHFISSYEDQGYVLLHSDRRADGILLDALIGDQPDSDLIPKLVAGLLAQRKAGKWANTQENSFILLALDRYFNTYEAQTPDFVARIWLGEQYAGEATFSGRTTEYRQIVVPMSYLAANAPNTPQDLILSRDGSGRLYYRLGLRYAPTDLSLPPYDAGFTVTRRYEAIDDPADVRQDTDGIWHIKAGARVRVRLTMVAPARRYHVALSDPLPAGLEPLNPALATTGSLPLDKQNDMASGRGWWWGPWYEHQNLRDQRAEAFASLLWEGVHSYNYVARATTPGTFIVPPAKAEEMYAPETFGRSGVDRVVVK